MKRSSLRNLGLAFASLLLSGVGVQSQTQAPPPQLAPGVDYTMPNYANSPLPPPYGTSGIRKFIDSLPGLGAANSNNLGNYIPIAAPDTNTFPGSDYYRIGVSEYRQKMHTDLPASKLRGYRDLGPESDGTNHYLGPIIVAQRDRPVRFWFTNMLPANSSLFLPVDTTYMGAGMGPGMATNNMELYSENRAVIHLHGGLTPWISDGTPHQWITPAAETTSYRKGASFQNVPDMVGSGTPVPTPTNNDGVATYYYPNQQSGRLLWYHDHAYGLTRLNVYAGEVAGYLLHDTNEDNMISSGTLPNNGGGAYNWGIPLILQDKTFVPSPAELAAEDPLWDTNNWGGMGNLWFPHVYMPNQNPNDMTGSNPVGRWDYGPWFWPPAPVTANLPVISGVPESFMDTPVVNGQAYPYLNVEPKAYRFRILNGCNDRNLNLQLYYADPTNYMVADGNGDLWGTEVPMIPAYEQPGNPPNWPTDGRDGGAPSPAAVGPNMVQIGTECGFLPAPVIITNRPVNYNYNRRDIVVLDINQRALFLGPAERADVIVDFSGVPSGATIILYNDAPAPVPAFDSRNDYYTGDPDQTESGGAPTTLPGYGPNTRTIMQFRVKGTAAQPYDLTALQNELPAVFAATQPPMIVPQPAYATAYGTNFPQVYSRIEDNYLTYKPLGSSTPITQHMEPKAIQELFDPVYGRMNSLLGVELPFTTITTQTTIPFYYIDPVTEVMTNNQVQIWKITHNGVDTHTVHFHLFNVQIINRVGWDGAIRLPEANELGWKEAVRMNPLEDCIIAMQPVAPTLPWGIPHSVRPMDVTMPLGSTSGFIGISPTNNSPITVTNSIVDFAWEYVWHCHLLGHEENDMMRPIAFNLPEVPPHSPIGLSATAVGTSQVDLSWVNASIDVVGIIVQRAVGSGAYATIATVGPTRTNYTDLNVNGGVTYKYRVVAFNAVGQSAPSNVASVTLAPSAPAMPTNLGATLSVQGNQSQMITVAWTNPSGNTQTGFTLQRATNSAFTGSTTTITLAANKTSYQDTSLALSTTYYYRLSAFNSAGSSAFAGPVNATTTAGPVPNAPTNLRSTTITSTYVILSWSFNGNSALGFNVERSSNGGTSWTVVAQTAANSTQYRDTGLVTKTTYQYRVQAYNNAGGSAYTSTLSVTTK